jgi:VWFA-related protein
VYQHIRSSVRTVTLLSIFLGAAAGNFGQTPSQGQVAKPSAIVVRSEIVLVPTVVTNRAGEHVPDLTQDQFTILENGHPQQIALFRHVKTTPELVKRPETPQNEFTNTLVTGSDRLTIFVLDVLNSSFTEQGTARKELIEFLRKSLVFDEPTCLITIDIDGVKVLHDFTTDPAVLSEALKDVTGHRSPKETPTPDPDSFVTLSGHEQSTQLPADRRIAAEESRLELLKVTTKARELAASQRVHLTLDALHQIAEAFSGIPGRKSLIWATAGVPVQIDSVTEVPEWSRDSRPVGQVPSTFGSHERKLQTAYENTWGALNRANIAVYPLDIEDLINPVFIGPSSGTPPFKRSDLQSNVSNLETFAEMTGGRLCDRRSDAQGCFLEAAKDSSDYYLLGYYKSPSDTKPGWRKLSVKVSHPEMQVRARAGYFARGNQDENFGREEDLQLGLLSPLDFTGLTVTVRWTPIKDQGAKKRIGFEFRLAPGEATIDEAAKNRVSLDFAAIATTPVGLPAGNFWQSLNGNLNAATVVALKSKGATYPGNIDLPPGDYTLRFLVRDNLSGQMGSVSAPLKVP